MSIIGPFTKDGTGYNGALRTLTLNAKARIVPNDTKTENAPDCHPMDWCALPL
jgi:uncharacterized protein (DUF736 family)